MLQVYTTAYKDVHGFLTDASLFVNNAPPFHVEVLGTYIHKTKTIITTNNNK